MSLTSERFELGPRIGRGTSGDVYRAIDRMTGEMVAVKFVDLEDAEDEVEDIQREIATLVQINSRYVTKYLGSWMHEGSTRLAIAMEYMAGGSVADLLESAPLPEEAIAVVCRDLLMALDYLHGEGKIHRDIKAANVLLSASAQVRLADFGVAGQMTHTLGGNKRKTFTGTPFWMAPEVIQSADEGYDAKADIWSLGITAMEMATGAPPYSELHPMRVLFFIPKNPPPRLEGDFSPEFKEFVARCLQKDGGRRPRARDLLDAPFIARAAETSPALMRRVAERMGAAADATTATVSSDGGEADAAPVPEAPAWDFGDGTIGRRFNRPAGGAGKTTPTPSNARADEDDAFRTAVAAAAAAGPSSNPNPNPNPAPAPAPGGPGPSAGPRPPAVAPAIALVLAPAAAAAGRSSAAAAEAAARVTRALESLEAESPGSSAAFLAHAVERLGSAAADREPTLRGATSTARRAWGGATGDDGSGSVPVARAGGGDRSVLGDFLLARWQRDLKPAPPQYG